MFEEPSPVVGQWYCNDAGERFEVVALDEEADVAEIQYFDGALEELDDEVWRESGITPVPPPEDWSGSLDVSRDDYGVDLEPGSRTEWPNPFARFER